MFRCGTILLLLGPFDGLWGAILDPKEITEGLDGLTGRWPSPTLGEGGQVHYEEEGCGQKRHIAGAGHSQYFGCCINLLLLTLAQEHADTSR